MDNKHIVKNTTLTVEKKSLVLGLSYLVSIENIKKSLKTFLIVVNCK